MELLASGDALSLCSVLVPDHAMGARQQCVCCCFEATPGVCRWACGCAHFGYFDMSCCSSVEICMIASCLHI